MRRLVKSFATIWPVTPASQSPRKHSYTASSLGHSKPSLAQRAHFLGGATGISRRGLFTLVSTKNHLLDMPVALGERGPRGPSP